MSEYQRKLETKLWAIADELRGNMDANEFKNYMLGFIFYKYLSEKIEIYLNQELKEDGVTFKEAFEDPELKEEVEAEAIENLGYFLEPRCLFKNIIKKAKNGEFILDNLHMAMNQIENSTMGHESEEDFENLFEDVDLQSSKLGKSEDDKNKIISKVLLHLSEIDFKLGDAERDILGDAYEYLISQFASSAGKKAGEFYTPQQVSKVLAKIVTLNKKQLKNVYDPTCGSGSLLLRVSKEAEIGEFFGQELNQSTYNLARMNMILHDVRFEDFNIQQGDSIENPLHLGMKFDAIVANPPFSAKWSSDKSFLDDERFSAYGKLAPKSKADFAFVQHMIYHLDENGTMAIVLPHGVLFRGAAEGVIRKYLVKEKNYLDAVIGLPANIFYGTSIPTVILVFKKCREDDADVFFIDASKHFEKVKNQNRLRDEDVKRIIGTYQAREDVDKFAHASSLDEIEDNDYNLNIPRYVDTFEEEELIDLNIIFKELGEVENEIKIRDNQIKKMCDQLGIVAPIRGIENDLSNQILIKNLRFKDNDGECYPEWKPVRLGEIANIYKGFTPSTSKPEYWNGRIPWLSIADMNQGKYLEKTSRTLTQEGCNGKRIIPKNSLVMSFKLTLGRVGILNEDMYSNEAICNFEWKKDNIDTEFMYYYLNAIDVRSFGSQAAKGITLNNESLNSIVVKLPVLDEQRKISSFLKIIDEKIDLINKELKLNEKFKKGLFQSYLLK